MPQPKSSFQGFLQLLDDVDMIDSTYPVRGCYIWKPFGHAFKEHLFTVIESVYEEYGYSQYQFPRIIPSEPLEQLAKEVMDFTDSVFWLSDTNEQWTNRFLTPTGEPGFYYMFKEWINTEADLPLRAYQRGSTFRPRKNPNVLLNNTEHMDVIEAHGAFSSETMLDSEFARLYKAHTDIHQQLALPYVALHRPREGNNPTYIDMLSFDTFLPSKNKTAYLGLIYKQSQIFSSALDVDFTRSDGSKDHTYQINFGFTDRIAAAVLDLHRDEKGLRLLPELAPTQVTIIPVYDGEHNDQLREYAKEIESLCSDYRIEANLADEYPSTLFETATKQGIPIQLRLWPEDLEQETVQLVPRTKVDDGAIEVPALQLPDVLPEWFGDIKEQIADESRRTFENRIVEVDKFQRVGSVVEAQNIAKIHWCGDVDCLQELNDSFPGELLGTDHAGPSGECIVCERSGETPAYFARRTSSA